MLGNSFPLVSVIIPAYKRPELLKETLASVYRQRGPFKLEVIVVDDCPTEPVRNSVNKYFPKVKYFLNKKNIKSGPTRNVGLKLARGDFVAFLDADDIWDPDYLALALKILEENSEVSGTVAFSRPCFASEVSSAFKFKILFLSVIRDSLQWLSWISRGKMPQTLFYLCQLSHLVFRARAIKDIRFDPDYNCGGEDWKYVLEVMDRGEVKIIPKRLVNYRYHPQSATFDQKNLHLKWDSYRQLFSELDKRNLRGIFRELFMLYISTFQGSKQRHLSALAIPTAFAILAGVSLITWFDAAGRKPFWLDEIHAYQQDASKNSVIGLLLRGARGGQGSPSPLSYVFEAGLYQLRVPLNYLGLQPWQYYRIYNPIFIIGALYLLLSVWPAQRRWLFLIAAIAFLFNKTIGYFATEMRPYVVWSTLSFVVLFSTLGSKFRIMFCSLLLLGLSATASVYQLLALAIALVINHVTVRLKLIKSRIHPLTGAAITLGLSINLYYISFVTANNYPTPSWLLFWGFWRDYLLLALIGFILAYSEWHRSKQSSFVASLTASIWIMFGPISFYMTRVKGFFFDPRQYIYYVPAVALLTYIAIDETLRAQSFRRRILFALMALVLTFSAFRQTTYGFQFAYHRLKTASEITIPANYALLNPYLPNRIPRSYTFDGVEPDELTNYLSQVNWQIFWQYLNEIYPEERYQRSLHNLEVRSRGLNQELVSVSGNSGESVHHK